MLNDLVRSIKQPHVIVFLKAEGDNALHRNVSSLLLTTAVTQVLSLCDVLLVGFFFFFLEGEVYTWGKGARGRLGRKEEDSGIPKAVQLDESHAFTVTSVACCHGNTLLAVKRNVA